MINNFFLKIAVCTSLLINGCTNSGDIYFNGTIEYAYTYSSDLLNVDSLIAARPAKGFFRYDDNDYQSIFVGADTNTYYYSGKTNKCISEESLFKKYTCEDYEKATDSVLSFKLYDTNEKILGYSCKILEIQKSNSWVKYYVSDELKISPATYLLHRAFNWDFYGEKAKGGLILKLEHRFKKFDMSGIATQLKKYHTDFIALELSEDLFSQICNYKK